ncbi:hypothetical protein [Endozoicomonas atrinae]|uniref:hypothetical protein n=1 Tax=Endozoicomonas atrinae TaxID=1333660 RepID=UPI00082443CF|nr:hypothetical protein [Endozoicomonas atrinae]
MLSSGKKPVSQCMIILGIMLVLSYSSGALSWFEFIDADPVQVDWEDQDIVIEMPFSLRSCFGNENLNDDGDKIFPCILPIRQNYSLQASDFNLTYDGSNGVDTTQRTIAEALFQEDQNSADLVNFQNNPTGEFLPLSHEFVPAKVTFRLFNNQLYDALPGTYSADVFLKGMENDGLDSFEDSTRFKFDIIIPKRVKISGLQNIELTAVNNNAINSGWHSFCIFSQGGTAFDLKAHGKNNANSFVLKQGTDLIDYELWIKAAGGTETRIIPMTSYQNWLGSISKDCQNNIQNNMELEVRIQSGSLTNTSAGVYKDTVTIIVEAV